MFTALARRVLGTPNDRVVKAYSAVTEQINALEPEIEALSDDALKARTDTFRQRLDNGETLEDLLVEAFGDDLPGG